MCETKLLQLECSCSQWARRKEIVLSAFFDWTSRCTVFGISGVGICQPVQRLASLWKAPRGLCCALLGSPAKPTWRVWSFIGNQGGAKELLPVLRMESLLDRPPYFYAVWCFTWPGVTLARVSAFSLGCCLGNTVSLSAPFIEVPPAPGCPEPQNSLCRRWWSEQHRMCCTFYLCEVVCLMQLGRFSLL